MKRRLLVTLDIASNKHTCGKCQYLSSKHRPSWCLLFTGSLDVHNGKALRAEECLDAETRSNLHGDPSPP